jgi:SSS family transporter
MGLDVCIIIAYIAVITAAGIRFSGKESVSDYFLGNRSVSWWLVCASVIATETSALTFISIPGLSYAGDMGFLQVAFGYLAGRVLVSFVLLPGYFEGRFETVYQFLERIFGVSTKKIVSLIFHCTRVLADGVRLFATALPLTVITGWDYRISILVVGAFALGYTYYGGLRSVIIVDAIQLVVYMGCAVSALFIISGMMDLSAVEMFRRIPVHKTTIISAGAGGFSGLFTSYNVVSGLLGGAFLSFASHGTDHLIVQRVLACSDLRSGRKVLVLSGVFIIFQFAVFLVMGLFLYGLLGGAPFSRTDDVLPFFVARIAPSGFRGLMLAGILATAMSTMSSTINSLASSSFLDLLGLDTASGNERRNIRISRGLTLFWAVVMMTIAFSVRYVSGSLVEIGLSIVSVAYGGMLGIFVIGRYLPRTGEKAAITGLAAGIAATVAVMTCTKLFWLWFVITGFSVTAFTTLFIDMIRRRFA